MIFSHFDWSKVIAEMTDETFGIPSDVVFQIVENDQLHEIKAHKMILAMVSPTFKTMFYSTDVGDKAADVIKIDKTTAPAFQILKDAIYNIKSIGKSFQGKSVDEVFYVVDLIERFHIPELHMSPTPFNWSRLIAKITDETFGILPDVVFQIVENDQLYEIKAHKMILAMVSPTFKTMFYSTDVGDKTVNVIKIDKTTAPAFQILKDAIYNIKSIGQSLQGKSVDEVFHVVDLIERYHIPELMEAVKEHLANFPITDDTVLEVAEEAMEYSTMFEAESEHLLLTCAKFLAPKLKDGVAMMQYAKENKDRKEVFATLLALMGDIVPTECPNCKKEVCQDGQMVKQDEFREGLIVTNNRASGGWRNVDYGTTKITKVESNAVYLLCIKPGVTQNGVIGNQFNGGGYGKVRDTTVTHYLYSCK